jgi:hypothetical protein
LLKNKIKEAYIPFTGCDLKKIVKKDSEMIEGMKFSFQHMKV